MDHNHAHTHPPTHDTHALTHSRLRSPAHAHTQVEIDLSDRGTVVVSVAAKAIGVGDRAPYCLAFRPRKLRMGHATRECDAMPRGLFGAAQGAAV